VPRAGGVPTLAGAGFPDLFRSFPGVLVDFFRLSDSIFGVFPTQKSEKLRKSRKLSEIFRGFGQKSETLRKGRKVGRFSEVFGGFPTFWETRKIYYLFGGFPSRKNSA